MIRTIIVLGLVFSMLVVPYNISIVETVIAKEVNQCIYNADEEVEKLVISTKPVELPIGCSCIQTARLHGVDIPLPNNAWDLYPNSETPVIGQLILLQYEVAHVAVIRRITVDGYWVIEGNFNHCEISERLIGVEDPAIRGFWTVENYSTTTVNKSVAI